MPSPEKVAALEARMESLGITANNLTEKFITGSGSGGQKINKTASCVYLKHEPSGIEVKCQRERSRELNRYLARRELCERLEVIRDGKKSARQQDIEKIHTVDVNVTAESMNAHVLCLRENGYKVLKSTSAWTRYVMFFVLGAYATALILQ